MTRDLGQAFNTFLDEAFILYRGCLIGKSDNGYTVGVSWFISLDRAKIEVDRNLKTIDNSIKQR